jgi:hypothetical protein
VSGSTTSPLTTSTRSRAQGRVSLPAIDGHNTQSRGRKVTSATGVSKVWWHRNLARPHRPSCDYKQEVMIVKRTIAAVTAKMLAPLANLEELRPGASRGSDPTERLRAVGAHLDLEGT